MTENKRRNRPDSGTGATERTLLEDILRVDKVIRDPVHGDIFLTQLEIKIIDTEPFQRLRKIHQLGTSYLVYPGAHHTRFEHALGCLYMADYIVRILKENKLGFNEHAITPEDEFYIRLVALLHDLAHIPFGHTLENEGNLFESQWRSKKRVEYFLGKGKAVYNVFENNDILKELKSINEEKYSPESIKEEVSNILKYIEGDRKIELQKPYIADIVGNTLCADLLDYVKRDTYYTGLQQTYDKRLLEYICIKDVYVIVDIEENGKKKKVRRKEKRVVLLLYNPKRLSDELQDLGVSRKAYRKDKVSELLQLLRLRYILAERVHHHHTKIASSAMLISAVASCLKENLFEETALLDLDDESLLSLLAQEQKGQQTFSDKQKNTEKAKTLTQRLKRRELYKPIYGFKRWKRDPDTLEPELKEQVYEDMRDWKNREAAEKTIENKLFLKPGNIVVYCPKIDMGAKEIDTLVAFGTNAERVGKLTEKADKDLLEEIESSIKKKHERLWAFRVFINKSLLIPLMDMPPEIPDYIRKCFIDEVAALPDEQIRIIYSWIMDCGQRDCSETFKNINNELDECPIACQTTNHRNYLDRFIQVLAFIDTTISITYEELMGIQKHDTTSTTDETATYSSIPFTLCFNYIKLKNGKK